MSLRGPNGKLLQDPFRVPVSANDLFKLGGTSPTRRASFHSTPTSPLSPISPALGHKRRNSGQLSYTSLAAAALTSESLSDSSLVPNAPDYGAVSVGSPMNFAKDVRGMPRSGSAGTIKSPTSPSFPKSPGSKSQVRLPPMLQVAMPTPLTGDIQTVVNPATQSWPSNSPLASGCDSQTNDVTVKSEPGNSDRTMSTALPSDDFPPSRQISEGEDEGVKGNADLGFVVIEAPTQKEAVQHFQTGLFMDPEVYRVHKAYRRFTASADDLNKDCLDLVASHLGYLLLDEEDREEMANQISDLSSFDVEELMSFLQAYASRQKDRLEVEFDKNKDGDRIPVDKLPYLMRDIKLVVTRDSLQELLQRAGVEDKETLDFDEVAEVVAAYRVCEGFTVEKLKEAKEKFDEAAENDRLAVKDVPNALLDFFGVHCVKHLRELVEAAGDALTYEGTHTPPVCFHEYLIWARHLQNAQLLESLDWFENSDSDADGLLSLEELLDVAKHSGFTLSCAETDQFLDAAELKGQEQFSFDDNLCFLDAVREGEGFVEKAREELAAAHAKFDKEGEGELTTIQVLDLLRYLGYQVAIEQVERYAKDVDFNGNGTMDIDEYLRLMRLHREDELTVMSKVFCTHTGVMTGGRLDVSKLHDVLNECKCCSSNNDVFDDLIEGEISTDTKSITWDEFRDIADKGRKAVKRAQRKKANFTDDEFVTLQEAFATYDKERTGILDTNQLLLLLHRCGVSVHHKSTRARCVEMLDKAREAALDAEIAPEDVGASGSCTATFWTMVHAWRIISRKNEIIHLARLEEATAVSNFSPSEVEEFQQIFTMFAHKKTKDEERAEEALKEDAPPPPPQARRKSVSDLYSAAPKEMGESTRQMLSDVKKEVKIQSLEALLCMNDHGEYLEFRNFKMLLGQLKLKLGPEHVRTLEKEMLILTGSCEGTLDFANFLIMMRWMLDTNFAHINETCAIAAKAAQPTAKASVPNEEKQAGTAALMVDPLSPTSRGGRLLGRRASM